MTHPFAFARTALAATLALACAAAGAAVSADEAAKLKTTLTPTGAERAANKDGTIPAWTGGFTGPYAGYTPGGRRPDPFADDKPLFTITPQNVAQYADRLSEGDREMFKKYPDYRINVYKTMRTHRQLPELEERTHQNALKTKLSPSSSGNIPTDYAGGTPFPIPRNGEEAMWNHLLRSFGDADARVFASSYLTTADGKRVLLSDNESILRNVASSRRFKPEGWDGVFSNLRIITNAPAIRAGEQLLAKGNLNADKDEVYAYLPGQRRVRRLPNACCDQPSAPTAGVATVDDTSVWFGQLSRFDWKLAGKKEMYVPYNTNRSWVPDTDAALMGTHFVNPEHVRWELHRVWVVEATLKAGQRHTSPKSVYYLDEDTWQALLGDRWDSKGQLWKHSFVLAVVLPDGPMTAGITFGFYDLLSGAFLLNNVLNSKKDQFRYLTPQPDATWMPDAMAGSGIR